MITTKKFQHYISSTTKKSILLLALLGGTATAAQAQSAIAAGTISLGGNIGYSRTTDNDASSVTVGTTTTTTSSETKSSTFYLAPSVGYFVADNLAVGLRFSYSARSNAGKGYTTYTPAPTVVAAELDPETTTRFGIFGQYYKMITDQFGVVGTLDLGYQSFRDSNAGGIGGTVSELKASGYYVGLTPSIIYFPIPKLGISASVGTLGYDRLSYDFPTNKGPQPSGYENKTSNIAANFGLSQLQFGGTYYFGR